MELPEKKVLTPEDIRNYRAVNVDSTAHSLREHGIRRSMNALFYTVPSAIMSAMIGHPGVAVAELLSSPVVLAGSHGLARLIETPAVKDWMGQITPKDVAVWNKLPPSHKAVFAQDLSTLVDAAKQKKMSIAPALLKFVETATLSRNSPQIKDTEVTPELPPMKADPKDLLRQANDLQDQFKQQGMSQ